MTGFILTCLLIGFGFAAILMGLVKSATNGKGEGQACFGQHGRHYQPVTPLAPAQYVAR